MNKKLIYIVSGVLALFLVIGLFWVYRTPKPMDVAQNGVYNYSNEDLGFTVNLPAEFQYFQTQSKQGDGYKDIEIFIPTTDKAYNQEVPDYAKPLVVRVYEKDKYKEEPGFEKKGETDDKVYALKFWNDLPKEWEGKWSEEMKNYILNSMKID
ncbi:MAG: hypothetical protein US81_C0002G0016 [Parcubacteria group bacterium GW2011_GWE2_38_18]|nr:MAG: hypothetical protein US81_C0002G0016 [Parcubacteria group bacterium GW2011_GWE2_38_18]